jgi:hypothetical protein
MSAAAPNTASPGHRAKWLSLVLVAAAGVYAGFHFRNAFSSDDAGRLETSLICSAAESIDRGPGTLYGPYTGSDHLVLIHGPLYYRLTASLAWPLARVGVATIPACLVAGRLLTVTSTLWLLFLTYRLSVVDGESPWGGLWAGCLVASSPVFGVLMVMVRPDTLAVAMQTCAVLLVVGALGAECVRTRALVVAYVLFALTFCAKQHDVVDVVVSSVLLIVAHARRKVRLGPIVSAHAAFVMSAGVYLAFEQLISGGHMWHTAFVLPGGPFRQINASSWAHVWRLTVSVAKFSAGLIALALASGIVLAPKLAGRRLDALILTYFFAELISLVPLFLFNGGSAENYVLQAIVFACVLVGRALARAVERTTWRGMLALMLAAVLLFVRDAKLVAHSVLTDRRDRAAIRAMLADPRLALHPRDECYFVDMPQHNRRFGAVGLIHDEWLFGAFETTGDAEPRSAWLRAALVDGRVRTIIAADERMTIPGLRETLPELGYVMVRQYGRYRVWARSDFADQPHNADALR